MAVPGDVRGGLEMLGGKAPSKLGGYTGEVGEGDERFRPRPHTSHTYLFLRTTLGRRATNCRLGGLPFDAGGPADFSDRRSASIKFTVFASGFSSTSPSIFTVSP